MIIHPLFIARAIVKKLTLDKMLLMCYTKSVNKKEITK